MSDTNDRHDEVFDDTVSEIRDQVLDRETEDAATRRAWAEIRRQLDTGERAISSCEDYQALLPAFVEGTLSEARALLVSDHTRECVTCRRALIAARGVSVHGERAERRPRVAARWRPYLRLAAAAVLVVGGGLAGFNTISNVVADRALSASVERVDGGLQLIAEDGVEPLAAGAVIAARQQLRTAKGSRALVRLADGSRLELDQRSELRLRGTRRGTRIELERGNILVHAAPQGSGRLWVTTEDCTVAVKGTVFAVNHGLKGSRVSVVEGEVEVRHGGERSLLYPGDQITTDERLARVAVEDEIAWSESSERYVALLRELKRLHRDVTRALDTTAPRTSSRLLDLAPVDTVVYAAIPNLSDGLSTARQVFDSHLAESAALRAWWDEQVVTAGIDRKIDDLLDRLQAFGDAVGDEIVVTVPAAAIDGQGGPLVLAVLDDPATFAELLAAEAERVNEKAGKTVLEIVNDPADMAGDEAEAFLWVRDDLFAAATEIAPLQELAQRLADPAAPSFAGSALHDRLEAAYAGGVSWLVGLDMHSVLEHATEGEGDELEALSRFGLLDASTLLVERHSEGESASTRAALDFDGPRRGLAAWLADPAPMGSLDFVSPQASLAAAVVAKDPAEMFGELLAILDSVDPDSLTGLADFEREHGFDLRAEIAAPLGGEAAFALDGPLVPMPSWKLVVEVYDPATLQHTIERVVEEANRELAEEGEGSLAVSPIEIAGCGGYEVRHQPSGAGFVYVVVDGYLVAAPQAALVEQALDERAGGVTLPSSAAFRDLLPDNRYSYCSALVYRDFGGLLEAVPTAALGGLPPEALEMLQEGATPSLFCVYGEPERIVVEGSGGSLLGAAPLLGLTTMLEGDRPTTEGTRTTTDPV